MNWTGSDVIGRHEYAAGDVVVEDIVIDVNIMRPYRVGRLLVLDQDAIGVVVADVVIEIDVVSLKSPRIQT